MQADLQLDGVFMATYLDHGLHFDFGYEVYLRTQEKIKYHSGRSPTKHSALKACNIPTIHCANSPLEQHRKYRHHLWSILWSARQRYYNPSPRFVSPRSCNPFFCRITTNPDAKNICLPWLSVGCNPPRQIYSALYRPWGRNRVSMW